MKILILQFLFIALLGWFANPQQQKKNKDGKSIFLVLSFLYMWYVHSMVDPNTFEDLPTYEEVYYSIGVTEWSKIPNHWAHINMELGYLYLNKLLFYVCPSFTVFLWVFSFFMIYYYMRGICKYSPYIVLSILLYLLVPYNQSLFVLRQHMAIAILFASIPLIIDRKLKHFLFVSFFAFFIHYSSICFFPIYFIYNLKGKRLIYLLCGGLVVMYFLWKILLTYMAVSFNYEWFAEETDGLTNITSFVQSLLILLLYIFALRRSVFDEGINKLLFIILILAMFTNLMSVGSNIGRMTIYFNVFIILSVPISLLYIKKKVVKNVIGYSIVLLYFLQMVYGGNRQYIENMQLLSLF